MAYSTAMVLISSKEFLTDVLGRKRDVNQENSFVAMIFIKFYRKFYIVHSEHKWMDRAIQYTIVNMLNKY